MTHKKKETIIFFYQRLVLIGTKYLEGQAPCDTFSTGTNTLFKRITLKLLYQQNYCLSKIFNLQND